jgi:hypothetical protein
VERCTYFESPLLLLDEFDSVHLRLSFVSELFNFGESFFDLRFVPGLTSDRYVSPKDIG